MNKAYIGYLLIRLPNAHWHHSQHWILYFNDNVFMYFLCDWAFFIFIVAFCIWFIVDSNLYILFRYYFAWQRHCRWNMLCIEHSITWVKYYINLFIHLVCCWSVWPSYTLKILHWLLLVTGNSYERAATTKT